MISIRIQKSYRVVVAIADSDLLGKKFIEGKKQLDIRENFYKDKEYDFEAAIRVIQKQAKEDATFNIVGPESIKAALEVGIISEKGIGKIQNIPFALVLI